MRSFGYPIMRFNLAYVGGGSEINSGLYHEPDKNFVKKQLKKKNQY